MDCQNQDSNPNLKGTPPTLQPSSRADLGAVGGATVGLPRATGLVGRCASPAPEDYVMVQAENLPADAAGGAAAHRPPNSVDLNAIFR